ncbi:quinone-dependent dihydroorotate dehydrogenase [Breoghania sp. L-A4]|uniref:quinone-dependent dihydroorotate dehydrogenase n=1 Tax=Breoghania sp. L-A4 TaxID=2304600 RepID=UPI000E35B745|nr:quinone-dependent dihydroorotate dehydrogenase [Breoghania sp. L-A4]AXS39637.1 quinone-dependent dihydroorotate dehydrogenase [Breoghania sp. L-A4]
MIGGLVNALGRKALFNLDAETAHGLTVRALASGVVPMCPPRVDPRLAQRVFGLDFANPVGLAAGFDKNGEVPDAVLRMGFGSTEIGTVTPRPQAGNPRPRVFRAIADHGVVNRLGFNNEGHAVLRTRLEARKGRGGIIGVNVGANKDTADRAADYVAGIEAFADLASYFTVNVSSPNTPGLRDLQGRAALKELLGRVMQARDAKAGELGHSVPVLLKIAPDVDDDGIAGICEEVLAARVDGLIISNTTITRTGLTDKRLSAEAGGLSGRPLFRRSTVVLAKARKHVGPDLPIIGVGGVDSGETAWTKITAGATLLQLYTGLIYEGPGLIGRILDHLAAKLDEHGLESLSQAVGSNVDAWADAPVDFSGAA